jgi:HD-GYP domain-containing protein (c-di-GMP phosphodiesterase class II)
VDEDARLLSRLLRRPDVARLTRVLRQFDTDTYRHSLRVARLAILLGRADGFADERLGSLAVAAVLHDLGKACLDPAILRKKGPLTAEERVTVRRHPALAVKDLATLEAFPDAHRIVPLHHELQGDASYPRSGKDRRAAPKRKVGERRRALTPALLRAGRILALADRYDALVSRRAYKEPVPDRDVRARLRTEMPDVAPLLDALPERRRTAR